MDCVWEGILRWMELFGFPPFLTVDARASAGEGAVRTARAAVRVRWVHNSGDVALLVSLSYNVGTFLHRGRRTWPLRNYPAGSLIKTLAGRRERPSAVLCSSPTGDGRRTCC